MPTWICATCGNHYPDSGDPPASCVICADERQWVPPSGQRWTTPTELAGDGRHSDIWEEEPGLFGLGVTPVVGIYVHAQAPQVRGHRKEPSRTHLPTGLVLSPSGYAIRR